MILLKIKIEVLIVLYCRPAIDINLRKIKGQRGIILLEIKHRYCLFVM